MTSPADIPVSSIPWLVGAAGILAIGLKSYVGYRESRIELSKYIAWFALLVGIAMAFFSVPTFFTLNIGILRTYDIIGEAFFYTSMVAQSAIVWFVLLRTRIPVYYLAVPIGLIGLVSWSYNTMRSYMFLSNDFITYHDPRASTLVIAGLMIGLFTPVGIYFLRLAPSQSGLKSRLNAIAFGLVYLGVGFISGGFEIATGQMVTRASAPGLTVFFIILLLAGIWPRRPSAKSPLPLPDPR